MLYTRHLFSLKFALVPLGRRYSDFVSFIWRYLMFYFAGGQPSSVPVERSDICFDQHNRKTRRCSPHHPATRAGRFLSCHGGNLCRTGALLFGGGYTIVL